MRRIIAGAFQSIDGVIQAPGGPDEDKSGGFALGGWAVPGFDEAVGAFMAEMMGGAFELLLARRTYEIFAAHFPRLAGDALADQLNATAKHVVTASGGPLAWNNSHALAGIDAVAALKDTPGADLLIQGSHTLHGPLAERGLIDRLFLLTFPVVLGGGKRLFDTGGGAGGWRLADHRVSPSGVVMTIHDRAGEVATGSFAIG